MVSALSVFRSELDGLPQGWFHHGPAILALLEEHRPRTVVELGTWRGASAIAMARVVRRWGGTVTCIDTWTGDAIHGGTSVDGVTFERTPGAPAMIAECAANLIAAGVQASVRLIPATTIEAARAWRDPIDFLYIDADHSFSAVLADLETWIPFVRRGGIVAGDDYGNPAFPAVRQAWDYVEREHGFELQHVRMDLDGAMELVYAIR
jgi:predicted O-methyltransferase YrrM